MKSDLETHIEALRQAAVREGIVPGEPLGRWVQAQEDLLRALADQEDRRERQIAEITDGLKARITEADLQVRRVDAAIRQAEIKAGDAEAAIVKRLVEEIANRLRGVVVLRELRWNRDQNWRRAALLGLLLAGLVLTGYAARAWEDRDATAMLGRCQAATVKDASGALYCPVAVMVGG